MNYQYMEKTNTKFSQKLPPCEETASWPCRVAEITLAAIMAADGGGPC